MSGPAADLTGINLAKVLHARFANKTSVKLIDSFAEPESRGDISIRPAGATTPDQEISTPGLDHILCEEIAEVRVGVAAGLDDSAALTLVGIVAECRTAILLAGYSRNLTIEIETLAQQQDGSKATFYIGGITCTVQVSAQLG